MIFDFEFLMGNDGCNIYGYKSQDDIFQTHFPCALREFHCGLSGSFINHKGH